MDPARALQRGAPSQERNRRVTDRRPVFELDQHRFRRGAIHFFKNITIVGGLLQIVAFGAGRLSLDARTR
ncbi:DoxX family protein [Xanthobacter dioxanivorans]|uniref:DoxX family protein n=1 Tax=Xanthobacter dioxanivorans TaxID=2528964 RepID=A0A974SLM9_9HYPH|nr:DoxX family protein [Xanthobacter dioxanivorans]